MTNMADTSLLAYFDPTNQLMFNSDEQRALYYIYCHPNKTLPDAERECFHKPMHTFSGRFTKLVEKGLIEKGEKVKVEGRRTPFYQYRCTEQGKEEVKRLIVA
jgi:DNA-binding MarR family transcriptional regulator